MLVGDGGGFSMTPRLPLHMHFVLQKLCLQIISLSRTSPRAPFLQLQMQSHDENVQFKMNLNDVHQDPAGETENFCRVGKK